MPIEREFEAIQTGSEHDLDLEDFHGKTFQEVFDMLNDLRFKFKEDNSNIESITIDVMDRSIGLKGRVYENQAVYEHRVHQDKEQKLQQMQEILKDYPDLLGELR